MRLLLLVMVMGLAPLAVAAGPHTADQDGSGTVSLSELLRVVQFFNSNGYACAEGTEDGYAPGSGAQDCTRHASDYDATPWAISLSELLRLIQFFNSGGYAPAADTEDGYGPGAAAWWPDLFFEAAEMQDQSIDTTTFPGHTLFRFSTSIPNIGLGELRLISVGDPVAGLTEVVQRIDRADGTTFDVPAPNFAYNVDTELMEVTGWAEYRLRAYGGNGEVGAVLADGGKTIVNITSSTAFDLNLPNAPSFGNQIFAGDGQHGISVGYTDLYPKFLEKQWIDVTGLSSGTYWLEVEINGARTLEEANTANNVTRIVVNLTLP